MGVKGIIKIIPRSVFNTVKLSSLKGKKLAVDISIYLYRWWSIGKKRNLYVDREHMNHIQGLLYMTISLLENGVVPLYVYDGKPPDEKRAVLDARARLKTTTSDGVETKMSPLRDTVDSSKQLLDLMGVNWVDATGEAEAYCAALNIAGDVDGVLSDDSDAYAFGALTVYSGLDITRGVVQVAHRDDILRGLGVTMTEFRYLCAILGNDYGGRVVKRRDAIETAKKLAAAEVPSTIPPAVVIYSDPANTDNKPPQRDINMIMAAARDSSAILYLWLLKKYKIPEVKIKNAFARLGIEPPKI